MNSSRLQVLALEPYYGGSHRAFLDRWVQSSRHHWECLTLPAHHWKWRMRHAAVTFSQRVSRRMAEGARWDVLFCSDMLSLAEFRGLMPATADLPAVAYFHENQLTYPVRHEDPRDLHFGLSNITTVLSATEAWFNSDFHRQDFLTAADRLLSEMPDHNPMVPAESLGQRCRVESPGCPPLVSRGPREPGPLRIAWAARWEHDKGPDVWSRALRWLLERNVPFEVSVMGEVFRERPAELDALHEALREAGRLRHWGWQTPRDYEQALRDCDVFVSTAHHEFFGLSVLEAVAAGALPLLPERLSYPELLQDAEMKAAFFYQGGSDDLARRLADLALMFEDPAWRGPRVEAAQKAIAKYQWCQRIPVLDDRLAAIFGLSMRKRV